MRTSDIAALAAQLTERDIEILRTLRAHRLATTTQLQRWHFADGFSQRATALRTAQRVLRRLEDHRLIARLYQRIGGVRQGSDSTVWQLNIAGDRLLAVLDGEKRRRYVEPRRAFIAHTIAVTELAVQLTEAQQEHRLDHIALTPEPTNWRRFTGLHGHLEILKPDLHAVTAFGDFEDHWLLERDMATEHPSVVVRKARVYERWAASGTYQREHCVFPAIVWIVPDDARREALERALRSARDLRPDLHRVIPEHAFLATVLEGNAAPDNDSHLSHERRDQP